MKFVLVLVNVARLTIKKFISLSLSLQVKHGFKAHACSMWYYGHVESIMESPDTAVYIFPRIYGDL